MEKKITVEGNFNSKGEIIECAKQKAIDKGFEVSDVHITYIRSGLRPGSYEYAECVVSVKEEYAGHFSVSVKEVIQSPAFLDLLVSLAAERDPSIRPAVECEAPQLEGEYFNVWYKKAAGQTEGDTHETFFYPDLSDGHNSSGPHHRRFFEEMVFSDVDAVKTYLRREYDALDIVTVGLENSVRYHTDGDDLGLSFYLVQFRFTKQYDPGSVTFKTFKLEKIR